MKRIMAVLSALVCFASAAFAESFVNLTTVKGDMVVTDGTRLHAVLDDSGSISIAPNATVTLWMAIIQESSSVNGAGITCLGDATIILESENYIFGRSRGFPAIYVPKGSTLTIKGNGKLTAIGNGWAAGIGGGEGLNCGNIVIDGGMITAEGGDSSNHGSITCITDDMILSPDSDYKKNSIVIHPPSNDGGGPGIGAAKDATCGSITFNRGNVTAYGYSAPGIGVTTSGKKCGKITFNRAIGDVHAITDSGTCISPSDKVVNNCRYLNGYVDKIYTGLPEKNDHMIDNPIATTRTIGSPLGEIRSNKTYKNNTIDGGDYFIRCNDLGYYLGDNHSPEGSYMLEGNERRSKAPEIPCLRGALSGDYRISIADGAIVELFDVTIGPSLTSDIPGITCNGNATIILYGDNYVAGHGEQYPGIYVPHGKTVKFIGPGSLTAVGGGDYGVGIGSCGPKKERGGNVEIVSGNITAIGGKYAPALGGTFLVQDGDETTLVDHAQYVYIRNGTVHTKGGVWEESDHFVVENHMDRTRSGNEEFFRWNGELDNLPVGPWIYAVAHNGTVIRGSLPETNEDAGGYLPLVTIAPDAEVELYGASLYASIYIVKIPWHDVIKEPRIGGGVLRCEGNATIKLSNDPRDYNVIKSKNETCPGIVVPEGATLTFTGDGSLRVQGGENSCAIWSKGTVVFDGGDVHVFDWPWDSSAPIENSSCQILWGGNYVFKRGSIQLYCDIDKNSKPPEISRFFYEDASREFGKGMVQRTGAQEWTAAPGEFEKGYWRNDITWDGSLDDLDEEEQGAGMKMKAMSALPALKSAKLLGAGDPDPTEFAGLLNDVASDAIAGDGAVITGMLSGRHKISIAPGATVTLRDATIWPTNSDLDSPYAGLTCLGDATIILEGENTIGSFNRYFPAIRSAEGCTLTIGGAGKLYAHGGGYAAAIGGATQMACGSIVIKGGDIEAVGGANSDVIGAGMGGDRDSVTVATSVGRLVLNKGEGGRWGITAMNTSVITYREDPDNENRRTYRWSGNLSGVTTADGPVELTAMDGDLIWGKVSGKQVKVNIAPGAKVKLAENTMINNDFGSMSADTPWAGITCLGDATITLLGAKQSVVWSYNENYPGIFVPAGSTLTIEGPGSLYAACPGGRAAGIGGGYKMDCGKIIVNSGTVEAEGWQGAGIGSGESASCEGVTIGSGIASVEMRCNSLSDGNAPNVMPLGNGRNGACKSISIGGKVIEDATGCDWKRYFRANPDTDLSTLAADKEIQTGATLTGRLDGDRKITVAAGAEIRLIGVVIAGGSGSHHPAIECLGDATIWLEGINSLTAFGDCSALYVPNGRTLTIKDGGKGYLYAKGGAGAAGIGAGRSEYQNSVFKDWSCGNIVIEGGEIVANGGAGAAGIGAGYNTASVKGYSMCGTITITGGKVLAQGGSDAAGIGYGREASDETAVTGCGNITIGEYVTKVVAICNDSDDKPVGKTKNSNNGVSIASALVQARDGNTHMIYPRVDLSKVSHDAVLQDGAMVVGELLTAHKISIADGATVTLSGVSIEGFDNDGMQWAGITCEGSATIILEGENTVSGYHRHYPGIYVPAGSTLAIRGAGSLTARGSLNGSAIGGGHEIDCGNIVIESGTITAIAGQGAAAIGGGYRAKIGNITINGGKIIAAGGYGAAAIGGGVAGACGTIAIGGDVERIEATCNKVASDPIGAGMDDGGDTGTIGGMSVSGKLIDITTSEGNNVTRTLFSKNLDLGTVTADITLYDGMVVSGTLGGACKISIAEGAHITLNQATILGEADSETQWAGLTCLGDATITLRNYNKVCGFHVNRPGIYVPEGSTLTIDGKGTLRAFGGGASDGNHGDSWAAGIGAGFETACGNIVINGGNVNGRGGTYAAGIGGSSASCGDITINGGTVYGYGGPSGAGIGGGFESSCGTITIGPGITRVTAKVYDEDDTNEPIGKGRDNPYGNAATCAGVVVDAILDDTTEGRTRTIIPPVVVDLSTVTADTVFSGYTIVSGTLGTYCKLSIADGAKVLLREADVNGAETWSGGQYAGLTCEGDATIVLEGENIIRGLGDYYAGIFVPEGKTLTIRGEGSLEAHSGAPELKSEVIGYFGAGIGGNGNSSCGNIVIESGKIYARGGGSFAAGIGNSEEHLYNHTKTAGTITIGADVAMVKADGGISEYSMADGLVATESGRVVIVRPSWDGDLATFDEDVIVADGTVITGSLGADVPIQIAKNATIVLYDAYIKGYLKCLGKATIILKKTNRIVATSGNPAIRAQTYGEDATIVGPGSLVAISDESWLWGYYALDGLERPSEYDGTVIANGDGTKTYIVAPSPTSAYDAWRADAAVSGSWSEKNGSGANAVANVFCYMFDEPDLTTEEMLDFELGADGRVVIKTPPVKNGTSDFGMYVVAADDVDFSENVVEYPLDLDGETAIDETDMVNRFFKVVAEPKW